MIGLEILLYQIQFHAAKVEPMIDTTLNVLIHQGAIDRRRVEESGFFLTKCCLGGLWVLGRPLPLQECDGIGWCAVATELGEFRRVDTEVNLFVTKHNVKLLMRTCE